MVLVTTRKLVYVVQYLQLSVRYYRKLVFIIVLRVNSKLDIISYSYIFTKKKINVKQPQIKLHRLVFIYIRDMEIVTDLGSHLNYFI